MKSLNEVKVLLISPIYDLASAVGTRAALKMENWLIKNNVNYKFLFAHESYRLPFEITSASFKPDFVIYFGHGEADKLYGQHILLAMMDINNVNLLKNAIIYTISCHTSLQLGRESIEKGIKTYFGNKDYYYGAFPTGDYDYLTDWLDYTTLIPKEMLMGKSAEEALDLYNQKIDIYIKEYNRLRSNNWDYYMNSTLANKENFELLGDSSVKLIGI